MSYFSWTLMEYQCCNHLKQWEVFQMNHENRGMQKLESNCIFFQSHEEGLTEVKDLFFFPPYQATYRLGPDAMRSYPWTVVLLAAGAAAQCRCDRYLCRTPFIAPVQNWVYRTVKSCEKLHISTPFVTPKVIINGFPFWIAVWEHVEIRCASHSHLHSKKTWSQINSYLGPVYPGGLWFLVPEELPKKHNLNSLNCILRSGQNEYTYTIEEMPSQEVMQ